MDAPVEMPYGAAKARSKYQGQAEPTPSRFYQNFE
jgi:dCTP deaminase